MLQAFEFLTSVPERDGQRRRGAERGGKRLDAEGETCKWVKWLRSDW
jgi:hypothetical protein